MIYFEGFILKINKIKLGFFNNCFYICRTIRIGTDFNLHFFYYIFIIFLKKASRTYLLELFLCLIVRHSFKRILNYKELYWWATS